MSTELGRPSELTPELTLKLERAFKSNRDLRSAVDELGLNYKTVEGWITRDYQGLRTAYKLWKVEKALEKSESFSEELLSTPHFDEEGKTDKDIMRLKLNEAQFLRETLGKTLYSKSQTNINLNANVDVSSLPEEDRSKLKELLHGANQS